MKVNKIRNSFFLVLAALIWGVAFVAQTTGAKATGPYTFNCIRSFIGGIFLLPVIHISDRRNGNPVPSPQQKKDLLTGGICCGCILFVATTLQQLGLYFGVPAGKAGFFTACYILIVPILGLFFHKRCGLKIWIGVVLAVAGLYLLCMDEGGFSLQLRDILVLICAVVFACHILTIDHFSPLVDGVKLSCIQFFVCGILGLIPMFFADMHHSIAGIQAWLPSLGSMDAWIPLLYAGVLSSGVGYTLQIVGQNGLNPTIASLLMSLESVFSVLAGWIILGQSMNAQELSGCVLIFIAIVLAQIANEPFPT